MTGTMTTPTTVKKPMSDDAVSVTWETHHRRRQRHTASDVQACGSSCDARAALVVVVCAEAHVVAVRRDGDNDCVGNAHVADDVHAGDAAAVDDDDEEEVIVSCCTCY